ncbi:MAG: hypothetical protein LBJ47_05480, partial [Tannerella sp.]|nr:hypothetical protein [Tannerella sp.]
TGDELDCFAPLAITGGRLTMTKNITAYYQHISKPLFPAFPRQSWDGRLAMTEWETALTGVEYNA